MLNQKLMGIYPEKLYVDDVFSTYLYTGNGSTQTINNGIDLAGKGGLVWCKSRASAVGHMLFDTLRGTNAPIYSQAQNASTTTPGTLTNFLEDGFSLGSSENGQFTQSASASWTFRRASRFFDVVTYTGDGTSNRQIAHNLGAEPGFITTKSTSATGDWNTYHRSATGDLKLNTTDAQAASRAIITAADTSTFTVSGAANTDGVQYVAYLWAHDPSEDGLIQCGSFTIDASGNATVNLGWEPQFILFKRSNGVADWFMADSMRGWPADGTYANLKPNASEAESALANYVRPTAVGFRAEGYGSGGADIIYLAIRRPNKPPKTGAEVYQGIARQGTSVNTLVDAGFPVDLAIAGAKQSVTKFPDIDRLRGSSYTLTTTTGAEQLNSSSYYQANPFDSNTGIKIGTAAATNSSVNEYVDWLFRRAPGFMEVVCDTGTGATHAISHNLTVAPELVIRKSRSAATQWEVWHSALAANEKLVLNSNAAKAVDATAWNGTLPGASSFTVGTGANVNASGATFVTYLFATLAGVSQVGQYTGNGSTQTIDCGFTTGARFILIKRTDSPGDWYVWDTARGIVAANDPHLSLNTTAAEVTADDSVDPDAAGFIVNQNTATNINVNGASYIFLTIA